jgi:type IV pilus assembly protein PilM
MARNAIGLDIGTRAVRLAEIQTSGGQPVLTRFGRMLLPIGAVDHGEIHDVKAVSEAITTLWKRLGLSGKSVHVGVANRRVVVRVIDLPAMSRDDLAGAIRFQAQEHIPIPLAEAVMDFEVLDEVENEEGEKFQRVLVVAAERGTIEPLLAVVRESRLELGSLELNAYPLVRCFSDGSEVAEAVVDIGAGVTNIVIHSDSKIRFTRILPTFGGDEFTQAVASALEVSRDEAETLKRKASTMLSERARHPVSASVGTGLSYATAVGGDVAFHSEDAGSSMSMAGADEESDATSATVDLSADPAAHLERAASVLEPMLDRFTAEIRGSIDFYGTQPGASAVERVVLTGGGSLMGGIAERLAASLGIAVEHGHPFERVPIGKVQVSSEERAIAEPFLGVAVGLALAGVK